MLRPLLFLIAPALVTSVGLPQSSAPRDLRGPGAEPPLLAESTLRIRHVVTGDLGFSVMDGRLGLVTDVSAPGPWRLGVVDLRTRMVTDLAPLSAAIGYSPTVRDGRAFWMTPARIPLHYDRVTGAITFSNVLGLPSGAVIGLGADYVAYAGFELVNSTDYNADGDFQDFVAHIWDTVTGAVMNSGVALGEITALDRHALLVVDEAAQSNDLNLDGDQADRILFVYDVDAASLVNTGAALAVLGRGGALFRDDGRISSSFLRASENFVFFAFSEADGGVDLNGDGLPNDDVAHAYDVDSGVITNLGLPIGFLDLDERQNPKANSQRAVFTLHELQHGADSNGDGMISRDVLHIYNASTGVTTNMLVRSRRFDISEALLIAAVYESSLGANDLNGDGDTDDEVALVFDFTSGDFVNTGLAATELQLGYGDRLAWILVPELEQGQDLNGDGDLDDTIAHVFDVLTQRAHNLGLDPSGSRTRPMILQDFVIAGFVESVVQADLDGDGTVSTATNVSEHFVFDLDQGRLSYLQDYAPITSNGTVVGLGRSSGPSMNDVAVIERIPVPVLRR